MFVFLQLNSPNYWQGCCRKIFLTVLDSCCRLHCYYCYYCCCCCSSCCWCCSGCWRWCWGLSGRRQQRMRWRSSPGRTLGWWCPPVPPSERSVRHSGLGTEVVSGVYLSLGLLCLYLSLSLQSQRHIFHPKCSIYSCAHTMGYNVPTGA